MKGCFQAAFREFKEERKLILTGIFFQLESTFVGTAKANSTIWVFNHSKVKAVALPFLGNIEQVVKRKNRFKLGRHKAWTKRSLLLGFLLSPLIDMMKPFDKRKLYIFL